MRDNKEKVCSVAARWLSEELRATYPFYRDNLGSLWSVLIANVGRPADDKIIVAWTYKRPRGCRVVRYYGVKVEHRENVGRAVSQ